MKWRLHDVKKLTAPYGTPAHLAVSPHLLGIRPRVAKVYDLPVVASKTYPGPICNRAGPCIRGVAPLVDVSSYLIMGLISAGLHRSKTFRDCRLRKLA